MIYLFERESEALRIETRYTKESKTYDIIWRRADGTTTKESFSGETSFRSRLDEIYTVLEQEHWHTVGPPHLLAGGWRISGHRLTQIRHRLSVSNRRLMCGRQWVGPVDVVTLAIADAAIALKHVAVRPRAQPASATSSLGKCAPASARPFRKTNTGSCRNTAGR